MTHSEPLPENLPEKITSAEEQLKAYAPYFEPERKKDSSFAQELGESAADLVTEADVLSMAGRGLQSAATGALDLMSGAADLTGSALGGAVELTGEVLGGALEVVGDIVGSILS
jgi:hypothetical protein